MPCSPGRRRWQNSLYARAALFWILGSASLIGAVTALSTMMLDESVDRLLKERTDLARTVGVLLEDRLAADLDRLAEVVSPLVGGRQGFLDTQALQASLKREVGGTIFSQGALVLDAKGALLAAVPPQIADLRPALALPGPGRLAGGEKLSITPLVYPPKGSRPVLVLVKALLTPNGSVAAYLAGVLSPSSTDLLHALARQAGTGHADFDLVDANGVVVASTDRHTLFRSADHGEVLTRAIAQHQDLRGQCHRCHLAASHRTMRATDVMAFAPLPTLELGVVVHQPEKEALAPAFTLRRRLVGLGVSFVVLFLLFAGASVRSVVHPVTRLTRAVREQENESGRLHLPTFGRDEVGTLARTLEKWRGNLMDSLAAVRRHQEALHEEIEATRRHLEALQFIAAQAMLGADAQAIVEQGLTRTLDLLGLRAGALRVRHEERTLLARRELSESVAEELLGRCERALCRAAGSDPALGFAVCQSGRTPSSLPEADPPLETVLGAFHRAPQGLEISCVLADPEARGPVEERWVQSLLSHLGISVMNRLLRQKALERQQLQAEYLRRVLDAQEDERRRVARELHDTVSQDLAALRLEIERLQKRASDPSLRAKLHDLEDRAHAMLLAVRGTVLDLRLSVLENMGFLPALQWHLERIEREHQVRGTLAVDGEEVRLAYERSVTLFRIFQEALQNAISHGHPEHVFVTVAFSPARVLLTVEDDGSGFDLTALRHRDPAEHGRGLGLTGMEERARLLGGTVEISSRPQEGTVVRVTVPLPQGERAQAPIEESA